MNTTVANIFVEIHRANTWSSSESRSGPGSTLSRTDIIRHELPKLLKRLKISSLLDAPCGDMNWIGKIELPIDRYIGVDIVPALIVQHQLVVRAKPHIFIEADLLHDTLPTCDAILCRDCLIHFSEKDIQRALKNFINSGATYLIATTHPAVTFNTHILTGEWRSVNLQISPYFLPAPLEMIVENEQTSKSLGVWRLDQLK